MKRALILVIVVLIAAPSVAVADDDASLDKRHLIATEEYTLTYDLGDGEEYLDTVPEGPIEVLSTTESSGGVEIEIRANDVSEQAEASVVVQTSESDNRISFTIYPSPDSGGDVDNAQDKAEKYDQLADQWVNQRVNRKQTDQGTLVVYEQRDPTKGSIDSDSGVPTGSWTEVGVDEDGDPKWLYDSPQGALAYTANKANTRYGERTKWIAISITIPVVSLLIQWIGLPLYRKRKEKEFLFG